MKKTVSYTIIALAGVVLILGIIAASFTFNTINEKGTAYYAEDGRRKVYYDVKAENEYIQVKNLEAELVTGIERMSRYAKYYKIQMDHAKDKYESNKTDENLFTYNNAVSTYEEAVIEEKSFKKNIFTSSAETFFGTYFPVVVLLGIALLINTKIDYKREK